MFSLLIKKNFPHVVIINDVHGSHEDLAEISETLTDPGDIKDVISGLKELHSVDITVCDFKVCRGWEGQVKITNPVSFGYLDFPPVNTRYNFPEPSYVKFKSDIWCLGCFLFGKNIPKRFLKSQELLDSFIKDTPDYIKGMLKINPEDRELPPNESEDSKGCTVQ